LHSAQSLMAFYHNFPRQYDK